MATATTKTYRAARCPCSSALDTPFDTSLLSGLQAQYHICGSRQRQGKKKEK
jgi:hypothetical protein